MRPISKGFSFEKLSLLAISIHFASALFSQNIYSRANADWDINTTWSTVAVNGASCGCVPGPTSNVIIEHNVDIDAGTGNVTVNSIKLQTVTVGGDTDLEVTGGVTLTVTSNVELEVTTGGDDAILRVYGAGTTMNVGGNFIIDQDNGDDIQLDVDDNCVLTINGNLTATQDGGDDIFVRTNNGSGTAGVITTLGDWSITKNTGDDFTVLVDDTGSEINIGGDFNLTMNNASDDIFTFDIDAGTFDVAGDLSAVGTAASGTIFFDLDGGVLSCTDFSTAQAGALFGNGFTNIFIDNNAQLNCENFTCTYTGADDFRIHLNIGAGNAAQLNVSNNFLLDCQEGDDVEIFIDADNSVFAVGGNLTVQRTGVSPEEFRFELDNDATVTVGGNATFTHTNGEDVAANVCSLILQGGGDDPLFQVDGNLTWTMTQNLVTGLIDLDGGELSVDGNMTVTLSPGANDQNVFMDGNSTLSVGGNLAIQLNGGDDLSFNTGTVAGSTPTISVGGNYSITHNANAAGNLLTHQIYLDTEIDVAGAMTLTTNFTAAPALTMDIRNTSDVAVMGNVNLVSPAQGELAIRLDNTTFFRIGGNFVRGVAPNNFGTINAGQGTPTIEYMGTNVQTIAMDDAGGTDFTYYHHLEIDNSFGTIPQLSMEGQATVYGNLQMNDGVVASNATNILVVADNGTTAGASNNSYVDGYMRKVGNDAFTFPVGDAGFYAPLGISSPGATTDRFEAQYFYATAHDAGYDSSLHDPTILYISKVEYWKLNRTLGVSNPRVTLSWDTPRSGGVGDINALRFARWDGSNWDDHGLLNVAGTTANGTIDNSVGITSFTDANPLTLATIDAINPLPIELLYFSAFSKIDHVSLEWLTKSEINNDYFTIEKSKTGQVWETLVEVDGAGNSSDNIEYDEVDLNPYSGVSYYRLKQTDFDGTYSYSEIVKVDRSEEFLIYPNPANDIVYISGKDMPNDVELLNALGQQVEISFNTADGMIYFSTASLAEGAYFIYLNNGGANSVYRIIVRH